MEIVILKYTILFYMTKKDPNYVKVSKFLSFIHSLLEALGLGKTSHFRSLLVILYS